jgi:hypothetical protein
LGIIIEEQVPTGVMNMPEKRILTKWFLVSIFCLVFFCSAAVGADSRFVDNGDGTVTDTKTGLMWAQTDNMGHISWKNAKLYCENIILSEHNDWRMPTIEELKTLFNESLDGYETICGNKVKSAPQVELSCSLVWSSEVRFDSGRYPVSALAYNYSKGYQYSARMTQYRGYRALPVRDVEQAPGGGEWERGREGEVGEDL